MHFDDQHCKPHIWPCCQASLFFQEREVLPQHNGESNLYYKTGDLDVPAGQPGLQEYPRRWFRINLAQQTTTEEFSSFVLDNIVDSFEEDDPSRMMM